MLCDEAWHFVWLGTYLVEKRALIANTISRWRGRIRANSASGHCSSASGSSV